MTKTSEVAELFNKTQAANNVLRNISLLMKQPLPKKKQGMYTQKLADAIMNHRNLASELDKKYSKLNIQDQAEVGKLINGRV